VPRGFSEPRREINGNTYRTIQKQRFSSCISMAVFDFQKLTEGNFEVFVCAFRARVCNDSAQKNARNGNFEKNRKL
jgi:hypothetical protein